MHYAAITAAVIAVANSLPIYATEPTVLRIVPGLPNPTPPPQPAITPTPLRTPKPAIGPRSLVNALSGRCFSSNPTNSYRYTICPFVNVTQLELVAWGTPFYSIIGVFDTWNLENDGVNWARTQSYTDGGDIGCGYLKRRRATVTVQCDEQAFIASQRAASNTNDDINNEAFDYFLAEEVNTTQPAAVTDIAEPLPCEYTMTLRVPEACGIDWSTAAPALPRTTVASTIPSVPLTASLSATSQSTTPFANSAVIEKDPKHSREEIPASSTRVQILSTLRDIRTKLHEIEMMLADDDTSEKDNKIDAASNVDIRDESS